MAERDQASALVPFVGASHPMDTLMAGVLSSSSSNGAHGDAHGPLMTFPEEQRAGAITGRHPVPQFFPYAPQFHWHVHGGASKDVAIRCTVENIARDAHAFGRTTEQQMTKLRAQQAAHDH